MDQGSPNAVADVTATVMRNLQDQHDWTSIEIQDDIGSRPVIRGLPTRRLYVHPDDQIAALDHEKATGEKTSLSPELEWVLPMHLEEKWTLARFAAVFDSIHHEGPRAKRIILGIVHNDSTVVYYFMHEGMVKPRQN